MKPFKEAIDIVKALRAGRETTIDNTLRVDKKAALKMVVNLIRETGRFSKYLASLKGSPKIEIVMNGESTRKDLEDNKEVWKAVLSTLLKNKSKAIGGWYKYKTGNWAVDFSALSNPFLLLDRTFSNMWVRFVLTDKKGISKDDQKDLLNRMLRVSGFKELK